MAKEKMSAEEIENWRKIKDALEAAGKTEAYFYRRAVAIVSTGQDPLRW